MSKLLLPYAYDNTGNLVHIDEAHKNEKYTCPTCGTELLLRISNIPEGEKYHRQNHFAHKVGTDNNCSESLLHKLFKNKVTKYINEKIAKGEQLQFNWDCDICHERHTGNLVKKAVNAVEEYDLKTSRPDIALFDKDENVIIVIEIVVTHKPEPETLKYYDEHNIACIQIEVETFDDCYNIDKKIANPDKVYRCANPVCEKCNKPMNSKKIIIIESPCWKCGRIMRIAMKKYMSENGFDGPDNFTEKEIEIAKQNGVHIEKRYSRTINDSYNANICNHCKAFIGKNFLFKYFNKDKINEIKEYECTYCKEREKEIERDRIETEKELAKVLDELNVEVRFELCPECGSTLRVRNGENGNFWGCDNYPECGYTKDIK